MSTLAQHLEFQLGVWPPGAPLIVAASHRRETPGWDGHVRPFAVMASPLGTVISVAPDQVEAVEKLTSLWGTPDFDPALAAALAADPDRRVDVSAVFRWCESPAAGDDAGEWVETDDPRVPPWLKPFNGGVLCAWGEGGEYIGGVGVKHHDDFAEEIAVGTEPAARGQGLGRRLVATATRAITDRGRVATYIHEPGNHASAHVADAAGFPDLGWRLGGFWIPRGDDPAG